MSESQAKKVESGPITDSLQPKKQQLISARIDNEEKKEVLCIQKEDESQEKGDNQFTYQQESIADRLLRQLEDQYLEVQRHNPKPHLEQQILKQGIDDDGEQEDIPEGYMNLGNGNQSDNNLNSSDESEDEDRENEGMKVQVNKQAQVIETDVSKIQQFGQQNKNANPEKDIQLVEVGPVPDSVFEVPAPAEETQTLEYDKIKSFALSFDIETPDWAKDPRQLEQKIRKLFQKQGSQMNQKQSLPRSEASGK